MSAPVVTADVHRRRGAWPAAEFSVARVVAETLALYDDALRTASLC